MTITSSAHTLYGLSTDTKPTDVDTNRLFLETDTLQQYLFDGAEWNLLPNGGVTGLNPNSTILEHSNEITDYTTPTDANATSPPGEDEAVNSPSTTTLGTGFNFGTLRSSPVTGLTPGIEYGAVEIELAAPAGNARVKIYDDNASTPDNLLAQSDSTILTEVGFNFIPLTTNATVPAGGVIHVAIEFDGSANPRGLAGTGGHSVAHTYGAGPDPFGVSDGVTDIFTYNLLIAEGPLLAIDGNTTTFWKSDAGINESITLDMGSATNVYGLAYYLSTDAAMTETQFEILESTPTGLIATGGDITQDGDFKVHTFLSTDNFEVLSGSGDVEYLVVAGGGGGGSQGSGGRGAGGGAGGYRTDTGFEVTPQIYTITVGAAGVGGVAVEGLGGSGGDSTFATITSAGGGGGGSPNSFQTGASGGSGGGGGTDGGTPGTGGAGNTPSVTPSQGNNGGNGNASGQRPAGGGGGIGAVGGTATTTTGGSGGVGLSSEIIESGTPVFYAGGGGGGIAIGTGGAGGNGGGGSGESQTPAVASTIGVANTGGGGGGTAVGNGKNGGSGIVVIRYFSPVIPVSTTRVLRTVLTSDLTLDAYNFIRFNGANTQFLKIEGSSGNSLIMAANELAVLTEPDPPLTTLHGQFTINPTDDTLPLDGGNPTSFITEDAMVNNILFNNVVTQNDPEIEKSIMWLETTDVNNNALKVKLQNDGIMKTFELAPSNGGITGFNPNSTILEYVEDETLYTTPTDATATSDVSGQIVTTGHTGSSASALTGSVWAQQITGLPAGLTVDEVGLDIVTGGGAVILGVYDDLAGAPNNLLGFTNSTASGSTGFIDFALTGSVTIPNDGILWVSFQANSASLEVTRATGVTNALNSTAQGYGVNPDPFGSPTLGDTPYQMRVTIIGGQASDAIDGDTATAWISQAGINESITLDMGSLQNCYGLAYYIDKAQSGITETQFQIKSTSLVENNDLKAYYQFDESSGDLINKSTSAVTLGSAADGTVTATQNVAGLIDRAYSFDGVADKVLLGSSLSQFNFMHNGTTPWTFLTWVKRQETGNGEIFDTNDRTNSVVGIGIGFNVSGDNIFCQVTNGSGNVVNFGSSTTITNDGNWHMVAVQFDGVTTYSIEIDDDGTIDTASAALAESASDAGFIAHVATIAAEDNAWLNGDLDEMSIWERQLTGAELESFYNTGLGRVIAQDTSEQILRTISVADLVDQQYNFIRFNGVNTQFIRVEGSSGNSLVMAANELAVQVESDPPLTTLHGQFTINGTNINLPLNGGDPTSSVIEEPAVNSLTLNGTVEQNDPPTGASVMWTEPIDSTNDGIFAKLKVDSSFEVVQVAPSTGGSTTFQPSYQFATGNPADSLEVQTISNEWRLPIDFAALASISGYVETAPTGADLIILIKKDGVTEATLIIVAGSKTGDTAGFTSGSILASDVITAEIIQVGSTIAGANLKISIIDGAQSSTKSLQFAATNVGTDVSVGLIPDVWRTPTVITTISEINAYVQIAPTGAAMTLDVKKDGVTEGTVTIAAGAKTGSTAVLTSGTIDSTNEITVDVTQVGSTIAGDNLKVNILGV